MNEANVKMELSHAVVTDVPVYESLNLVIDKGLTRALYTELLCRLGGSLYMGCYSIGEPFKLSCLKLDTAVVRLIGDADNDVKKAVLGCFPRMNLAVFAQWLSALTDKHLDERYVELKWDIV